MKRFHVISLFPEALTSYLGASIIGRAEKAKKIKVDLIQLREYAEGRHRVTDESPYGGGPGMVLKAEPIARAVAALMRKIRKGSCRTVLFSTRGKIFDQKAARRLARYNHLILICGRYEGVDERVATHIADEEVSLGDFVLSGGEIPALALIDAVARQVPGVLGKAESLEEVKGSYPVYTKPASVVLKKRGKKASVAKVPEVLLSGDHAKIDEWRKREAEMRKAGFTK